MSSSSINENWLTEFQETLQDEERSPGTIENYLRAIRTFVKWLNDENRHLDKETAVEWKTHLIHTGYRFSTVNTILAALNKFFTFLGRTDCRMKYLRIQRKLFRSEDRELSRDEYQRLVAAAQKTGQQRLALLIESICATGIRVSEVNTLQWKLHAAGRQILHSKEKSERSLFLKNYVKNC